MTHEESAADDYMIRQEPPEGLETRLVLPLGRTRVEMGGDAWFKASVLRRAKAHLDELADDIRASARAWEVGDGRDSLSRAAVCSMMDMAEHAERIGREAMRGIDGEEPEEVGWGGGT